MTGRLLHISDLHVGRGDSAEQLDALRELVPALEAELVVVTGDLAHRGRSGELERAGAVLHGLGPPVLAVPGNHDLPYAIPARFTRTADSWNRVFGTTEPTHITDRLAVLGLDSTRPWRTESGALAPSQLDRVETQLSGVGDEALRVVALHHHLAAPPWRAARKRPVRNRDDALRRLVTARVELVLSGHVHQSSVTAREEFEVVEGERGASIVLATVAGLGRPRPHRGGEAVGFTLYEFDRESITAVTWAWSTARVFAEVARRRFRRG